MASTCQMVAVSHRKPVNTTRTSSACPLLAMSPTSPARRAIVPSTVVIFRKITPCSGWGLVCRSAAALTAQMEPSTSPSALAAHALDSGSSCVPSRNAVNDKTITAMAADETRSLQVSPMAGTSRSMGANTTAIKSAPKREPPVVTVQPGLASSGLDETLRGGGPSPRRLRGDVASAYPAVYTQELHAVGLLLEYLLTGRGQPQGHGGVGPGVAEGRGGRELLAVRRFDQSCLAAAQGGEGAVEPGVPEERRHRKVLCCADRRRWRDRAGRDGLQCPPFGPRQAVLGCGQLFQQPPQRRAQERQLRHTGRGGRRQRGRLGPAQRVPGRGRRGQHARRGRDAR